MCRRIGGALNRLGSRRASVRHAANRRRARLRGFAGVSVLLFLRESLVFVAAPVRCAFDELADELPAFRL